MKAKFMATIVVLTLSACGGSSANDAATDTTLVVATDVAPDAVLLADVCPAKIVIQTDWFPESEHGGIFELLGDDAVASKDTGAVVGSLNYHGSDTGVDLEIRAGGPFLQVPVVTQMFQDNAITLGFVGTDVAIKTHADTPTLAVISPLNKNPQVILWDATKHPNAKTIADISKEVSTVYVYGDPSWMRYLNGIGAFTAKQVDSNYQGNLLLATEDAAHQGFATSEPYKYSVLDSGAISVGYELIHDTGWTSYPQSLSIRADRLEELSPCLTKLVPILQQAQIDYINAPERANAIIITTTVAYDSWWSQSEGDTANGAQSQKDLGIIGNGETPTFGDTEEARVTDFIAKALPIFREQGLDVSDVVASDLATNQFIDSSITYNG